MANEANPSLSQTDIDKALGPEWSKILIAPENYYLLFHDKGELLQMKETLEKEGFVVDKFLGAGSGAFVFTIKGMKGMALRIEPTLLHDTLDSPIVLKTDYDKILTTRNAKGIESEVRVRTLLLGDPSPEINMEDLIRTGSVLKACGHLGTFEGGGNDPKFHPETNRWADAKTDQLYYLRDPNGDYLRYPSNGKPIAYIGDIGGTTDSDTIAAQHMAGAGNIHTFLKDNAVEEPLKELIERLSTSEPGHTEAEKPCAFFAGWDSVLEKILQRNNGRIRIALAQSLPEGWEEKLRQIHYVNMSSDGSVDKTQSAHVIPEPLASEIEKLLKEATKSGPQPNQETEIHVPLKLIDDIIPVATQEDIDACNRQNRLLEAFRRQSALRPSDELRER